ncbi:hypothetical protein ABTE39_20030, partial [Acinetobacter baumannii]
MPSRRDFLETLMAAPALAMLARPAAAQTAPPPPSPLQAAFAAVSDGQPVSRQALLDYARELSKAPYQAPRA